MAPFPYSSKDIDGDMGGAKYSPIPIGEYEFIITEVKEKMTKNNDPMVNVTLEIMNQPSLAGRLIWHNVTFPKIDPTTGKRPSWAGMGIHFLKSIGEPWEGDFIVTPEAWIGKTVRAKTKMGKDQKNNDKAEIAYIIGDEKPAEEALPF